MGSAGYMEMPQYLEALRCISSMLGPKAILVMRRLVSLQCAPQGQLFIRDFCCNLYLAIAYRKLPVEYFSSSLCSVHQGLSKRMAAVFEQSTW